MLLLNRVHLNSLKTLSSNNKRKILEVELPSSSDKPIKIIDLSGNLIREFETDQVFFQTDISDLANGVYFMNFNINGNIVIKRIVLQK